jgi:hypothetical protein
MDVTWTEQMLADSQDELLVAVAEIQRNLGRVSRQVEKVDKSVRRSGRFVVNVAANIVANLAAAAIAYIAAVVAGYLEPNNAILLTAAVIATAGVSFLVYGFGRHAFSGGDQVRLIHARRWMTVGLLVGAGCVPSVLPVWVGRVVRDAQPMYSVATILADCMLTMLVAWLSLRSRRVISQRKCNRVRLRSAGFKVDFNPLSYYSGRLCVVFAVNSSLIACGCLFA